MSIRTKLSFDIHFFYILSIYHSMCSCQMFCKDCRVTLKAITESTFTCYTFLMKSILTNTVKITVAAVLAILCAQWLVQRTVNPPIQVRFLYSPYFSQQSWCEMSGKLKHTGKLKSIKFLLHYIHLKNLIPLCKNWH